MSIHSLNSSGANVQAISDGLKNSCSMYYSTNGYMSKTKAAYWVVTLDATHFDTTGTMADTSNSRINIPEDGYYLVTWSQRYPVPGATVDVTAEVAVRGGSRSVFGFAADSDTMTTGTFVNKDIGASETIYLYDDEYIDMSFYWTYGGSGNYGPQGSSTYHHLTFLQAIWMGS